MVYEVDKFHNLSVKKPEKMRKKNKPLLTQQMQFKINFLKSSMHAMKRCYLAFHFDWNQSLLFNQLIFMKNGVKTTKMSECSETMTLCCKTCNAWKGAGRKSCKLAKLHISISGNVFLGFNSSSWLVVLFLWANFNKMLQKLNQIRKKQILKLRSAFSELCF